PSGAGPRPVAHPADRPAEGVRQIRALDREDHTGAAMPEAPVDDDPVVSFEAAELTILTCWAEAVAEALAASPDQLNTILDDARAGAPWRRQFGVAEPSAALASALEDLTGMVPSGSPTAEAVLAAIDERPRGGDYGHLGRLDRGVRDTQELAGLVPERVASEGRWLVDFLAGVDDPVFHNALLVEAVARLGKPGQGTRRRG